MWHQTCVEGAPHGFCKPDERPLHAKLQASISILTSQAFACMLMSCIYGMQAPAKASPEALMRLVSQSPLPAAALTAGSAKQKGLQRRVAPTPVPQVFSEPQSVTIHLGGALSEACLPRYS